MMLHTRMEPKTNLNSYLAVGWHSISHGAYVTSFQTRASYKILMKDYEEKHFALMNWSWIWINNCVNAEFQLFSGTFFLHSSSTVEALTLALLYLRITGFWCWYRPGIIHLRGQKHWLASVTVEIVHPVAQSQALSNIKDRHTEFIMFQLVVRRLPVIVIC